MRVLQTPRSQGYLWPFGEAARVHLYVDESGAPGPVGFFLVCCVAIPDDLVEPMRERVLRLEQAAGRTGRKWVRSNRQQKIEFLAGAQGCLEKLAPVYWRRVGPLEDRPLTTALLVADVAEALGVPVRAVVIDALSDEGRRLVRGLFTARKLRCRKITVGARDESEPLLRLADALAGFLADVEKAKDDGVKAWERLGGYFQAP